MAKDFNWYDGEDAGTVVFPTVQAVAVYTNAAGAVVIRQQDSMGGEDSVVVIPLNYVDTVIAAIRSAAAPE